jgi:IPT/TIG domain-containing protein/uncharacterized protein DUF3108
MKKNFFLSMLCLSSIMILSQCKKDPVLSAGDSQQAPAITSLTPASGSPGTAVTIEGKNFGSDTNKIRVTFDGIRATLVSAEVNKVVVKAPSHDAGKVAVLLTANGLQSKADTFMYAGSVYGYAPHLAGTTLTYDSHDTVSSASSNSTTDNTIIIKSINVEDSDAYTAVQLLSTVSSSAGTETNTSDVWFNKENTSFTAIRPDEFDSIVQLNMKLPNTTVTHSDGMETFTVPNEPKAGDAVDFSDPTQFVKAVTKIAGTSIIDNISFNFSNGTVLGTETITTPAGTFNCVKISYSYEYNQHFTGPGEDVLQNEVSTYVEWLVPGIGPVKISETMAGTGNSPSVVNDRSVSELVKIEN